MSWLEYYPKNFIKFIWNDKELWNIEVYRCRFVSILKSFFKHWIFLFLHFFFLDNRALPINRKQKVFPNGTLIIENVERNSDQATYTCVAKNVEGYSARGSLEVQVMGKFSMFQTRRSIMLKTNIGHNQKYIKKKLGKTLGSFENTRH